MLKYCKKCVLPNTRPNIIFDKNQVCDGCSTSNQKSIEIDWQEREKNF